MRKLAWIIKVPAAIMEGFFWVLQIIFWVIRIIIHRRHAKNATQDGELRCPRGHLIPTHGTWECTSCSFVYVGSPWLCPNPECPQPFCSHVQCPEPGCGLSQRNPHRYGGR